MLEKCLPEEKNLNTGDDDDYDDDDYDDDDNDDDDGDDDYDDADDYDDDDDDDDYYDDDADDHDDTDADDDDADGAAAAATTTVKIMFAHGVYVRESLCGYIKHQSALELRTMP